MNQYESENQLLFVFEQVSIFVRVHYDYYTIIMNRELQFSVKPPDNFI